MAWETRRGGRTYYYRKVRDGETVQSEYIGQGPAGALACYLDTEAKRARRRQIQAAADEAQAQRRIDACVNTYRRELRAVVAQALRLAGYHQHKGQWRLKRRQPRAMAEEQAPLVPLSDLKEYERLYRAAERNPTPQALERLRAYAVTHPSLFDQVSTLASVTLDRVIEGCTQSEATRIHLRSEAQALGRRLGYQEATPLERLLIDDIVLCWLRLAAVEDLYTANYQKAQGDGLKLARYMEGRLNAARRRYLQSIEALARVQGLLKRVGVQVNIAAQQVVQNG